MQECLEQECLEDAPIEGLQRLAEFLGVAGFGIRIRQHDESLAQWRRTLVFAILREEKRIASLPHAKRWELPQNRVSS